MAITIVNSSASLFTLSAEDIQDGRVYLGDCGELVIGNQTKGEVGTIKAFGVDGHTLIWSDSFSKFREIDIEIKIL